MLQRFNKIIYSFICKLFILYITFAKTKSILIIMKNQFLKPSERELLRQMSERDRELRQARANKLKFFLSVVFSSFAIYLLITILLTTKTI